MRAARAGGVVAIAGGLAWVVKGGVILATGDEPPVAFALGMFLFPLGTLGLASLIGDGGRARTAGRALAVIAFVSAIVAGAMFAFAPASWEPTEERVTPITPFIVLGGFGAIGSILLVGLAVRRARPFGGRLDVLPLAIGVGAVPAILLGAALGQVNERLIEVAVVAIGLAWIVLGRALVRAGGSRAHVRAS